MVLENPMLYTIQCTWRITDFAEVQHNIVPVWSTSPHPKQAQEMWFTTHIPVSGMADDGFKKFKINQAVVINCDTHLITKKFFGTVYNCILPSIKERVSL